MPKNRLSAVFVDVCTQRDYLSPNGARLINKADIITSNMKHVMALARWTKVPMLSCVDTRRPNEVRGISNPCCVLGTLGQRKTTYTLLPNHIVVQSDNCLCVPLDLLQHYQQAILSKQHRDPFTNPKLDRLLTEIPTHRFLVFGVSLELSIKLLVLGLLLRHRRVTLIGDACGYWNPNEADMTLRQLAAKGCEIMSTRELIETQLAKLKRRGHNGFRQRRWVA
ncbi:MAG: isochorismatase family protein [Planctomycetota bacterium]